MTFQTPTGKQFKKAIFWSGIWSLLISLLDQVYVRQELWKYRKVFDSYEKKWMSTPFKTLAINQVSTKVECT